MAEQVRSLGPARADNLARLVAATYAGSSIPFLAAVLPRNEVIVWAWLIPGLLVIGGVIASAGLRLFRISRGQPGVQTPARFLGENLACLVGMAAASYGLSGAFGMYRLALLGPVLLMAVTGTDRMLAVSLTTAVSLLVLETAGSLYDLTPLPAFAVVWGSSYLLLALLVRTLARRAERATNETAMFAEIADVAASASHIYAALDDLMPVLRRFLDAKRVVALPVRQRRVEETAIASWPTNSSVVDGDARNDARIAAMEDRTVARDWWTCAPVRGTNGVELVLFVEHAEQKVLRRLLSDDALEQVTVQLGALCQRLDLIAELEGLTRTDSLTGLPNRRALAERLERELAVARRSRGGLSLAMIDLDHFKQYNDSFGHLAGDELLRQVAEMLKVRLRVTDFVARYGGEEFCAILPYTDAPDAATVLNEIHRRGREIDAARMLTFSAGVAEWDGEEAIDDLIDRADRALYDAKSAGRARTCIAGAGARPPVDDGARPARPVRSTNDDVTVVVDEGPETGPVAEVVVDDVAIDVAIDVDAPAPPMTKLTPSILEGLRRPTPTDR